MTQKVVPIPFLGKEVSGWLYRTTKWSREHPYKAFGVIAACVGGSLFYEAQITHKDRIPSPNVNNHLEYQLKRDSLWGRWFGQRNSSTGADNVARVKAEPDGTLEPISEENLKKRQEIARRNIADTERLLLTTTDPKERAALEKVLELEKEVMQGVHDTTMVVRSGQLLVRAPHWEIRNNELNWSILSRDQQQQKDHYWYRLERSREDDYARNTYSRP